MRSAAPPTSPPHALRSAGAVIAGLVAIVVLSLGSDATMYAMGLFPPRGNGMPAHLWALATVYRSIYAVLGSFIAAYLAPHNPMRLAMILGTVGVVLATVGIIASWNAGDEFGPKWYPIALVITALPCAWIGGKLHQQFSISARPS